MRTSIERRRDFLRFTTRFIWELVQAAWAHPWVRRGTIFISVLAFYDLISSQIAWWPLPKLWEMVAWLVKLIGPLLPWWGWLSLLGVLWFAGMFEAAFRHHNSTTERARVLPIVLMISGFAVFAMGALLFSIQTGADARATPVITSGAIEYEITHRLEGIDKFRDELATTFPILSQEGRQLATNISGGLQRGSLQSGETSAALTEYAKKVETKLNFVQDITRKYKDYPYMSRIFGGYDSFNPYEVVSSARNLVVELRNIPENSSPQIYRSLLNNQHFVSFDRSAIELQNWTGRIDNELGAARKEILAIPIISDSPHPAPWRRASEDRSEARRVPTAPFQARPANAALPRLRSRTRGPVSDRFRRSAARDRRAHIVGARSGNLAGLDPPSST